MLIRSVSTVFMFGGKSISPGSLAYAAATIEEKILLKNTRALVIRCVRG